MASIKFHMMAWKQAACMGVVNVLCLKVVLICVHSVKLLITCSFHCLGSGVQIHGMFQYECSYGMEWAVNLTGPSKQACGRVLVSSRGS